MADGPLVGQAVEMHLADQPDLAFPGVVFSSGGPHILLGLGPLAPWPPSLESGARVRLRYTTTLGLHELATSIVSVGGSSNVTLALDQATPADTIQRRHFFRVPACLAVAVRAIRSATAAGLGDARAITEDISAGGMRLETALHAALGDQLQVVVQTPRNFRRNLPAELACQGRVVRVLEAALRGRHRSSLGLEFAFELERERDRWVQLTFDLQRGVQI